jgi:hypothetical protein
MAIAVIGGLMTSTLLSLLVIPALFTYVDDLEQWLHRMRVRLFGHNPAPESAPTDVVRSQVDRTV